MNTQNLTVKKIHDGLRNKIFSAQEIVTSYVHEIENRDSQIGAFLETWNARALTEAAEVDKKLTQGIALPPLAGVSIAFKDNIAVLGEHCSAGSKMLEHYTATYDAGVVQKLKSQHAVLIGRTNCDEFAMGSSTENSAYKKTHNPHDLERVPGGSSGGSAAAVAANFAPAALGSDTGGSIRQPADLCGVVGMKPTYGAVSRSGLIAMASSLDQIGPFAKTVEDAAMIFSAITGKDPLDNTSVENSYDSTSLDPAKARGMTVGLPAEYFVGGIEPEVRAGVEGVIKAYEAAGVKFKKISLPHTKYALSVYYIIQPAEVSSNLARFDGIRYGALPGIARDDLASIYTQTKSQGFGPETKRRIILGTFVLSSGYYDAYYKKAQSAQEYIRADFAEAFKEVDAIITPVAPTRAFKLGEKSADPLTMYLCDIFTIPANLSGIPAISIPVTSTGQASPTTKALPTGFQIMTNHFRESDLFNLGRLYETL